MFTGIIETIGKVEEIIHKDKNKNFLVSSNISVELKINQSLSHDGVCLTVTKKDKKKHWVTAVDETIKKSNLGKWEIGSEVNLERCVKVNGRLDGHIVQGHVDTIAQVMEIKNKNGSKLVTFKLKEEGLVVEKGSVCLNGISLTCFDVNKKYFSVAIIPYTYKHTNFRNLAVGNSVNVEFDIIGKYLKVIHEQAK